MTLVLILSWQILIPDARLVVELKPYTNQRPTWTLIFNWRLDKLWKQKPPSGSKSRLQSVKAYRWKLLVDNRHSLAGVGEQSLYHRVLRHLLLHERRLLLNQRRIE